ncbi:MAG TPA: DNA translocase FtsK, partial [Pyrinomonadaceae bacterium]|nr:DNA translocase FtsK [Pyrinomonadaceae bacterium]
VGTLIARVLTGGLNTVGAGILLFAAAAAGLLLATNFSFARLYERIVAAFGDPANFFAVASERFNAWRAKRREEASTRAEMRRTARAEREGQLIEASGLGNHDAERSGSFVVKRGEVDDASKQATSAATAIKRAAVTGTAASGEAKLSAEEAIRAKLAQAEAELASIAAQPFAATPVAPKVSAPQLERPAAPAKRAMTTTPAVPTTPSISAAESIDVEVEEMVRTASVVRTEAIERVPESVAPSQPTAQERAAARKAERIAAALSAYKLPDYEFLHPPQARHERADEELRELATQVAEKCREFNVTGKIEYICPGPVVTTYEFKPDPGVKYSRVTGLVDDLCLALKAESIRIDRVPGKAHVGIEVPNPKRETIGLREVVESRQFRESPSKLTLALGKTIDGLNYVADLAKMPHLLIAGATGAGKSVGVNSLIVSILYKARPDEVKFIMVDPKRLELGLYADIPHLATPIITDPKRAAQSLKWAVAEMEKRYKDLAGWGVRNIDGFNTEITRRNAVEDYDDEGRPWKPLPYIVIIIDELADLMMVSGHEVEESITRLAQMARAVGIHLVLATQRPSVDVITGLIKANFPSRIAYRVSSKVDSRTIIDANGAEQLLGRGDMLFLPPGTSRLVRVHGAYVDEAEINKIVKHIKDQGEPAYDESITQSSEEASGADGVGGERDEFFEQALRICVEMKRASTSVLQRRLRIGYGRAAAILDAMEREGFIGQADGARPRPVLERAFESVAHWDDLQADSGEL